MVKGRRAYQGSKEAAGGSFAHGDALTIHHLIEVIKRDPHDGRNSHRLGRNYNLVNRKGSHEMKAVKKEGKNVRD
jgi:hypothetical protein